MIRAEYTYTLPAPPHVVFPYMANPVNDMEWQNSCTEAALLGPEPVVGCRYTIVFSFLGRKMQFLGEITDRVPEREFAFKVIEGSFHYEGRYSFRPHPDGTEVHWVFDAEPGKFFGILPVSLVRKLLISQVQKDVATLLEKAAQGGAYRAPHPALAN